MFISCKITKKFIDCLTFQSLVGYWHFPFSFFTNILRNVEFMNFDGQRSNIKKNIIKVNILERLVGMSGPPSEGRIKLFTSWYTTWHVWYNIAFCRVRCILSLEQRLLLRNVNRSKRGSRFRESKKRDTLNILQYFNNVQKWVSKKSTRAPSVEISNWISVNFSGWKSKFRITT